MFRDKNEVMQIHSPNTCYCCTCCTGLYSGPFLILCNRKPNLTLWEGPKHLTQVRNNQCLGFIVIRSPCHNTIWPQSWTLYSSHILLWLYFLFISFCASSADRKTLHRVCFHSPHKVSLLCHGVGVMLSQGSFRAGEKINICGFGKPIKLIICEDLKSAHTPTEDATWCLYQAAHPSGMEYLSAFTSLDFRAVKRDLSLVAYLS